MKLNLNQPLSRTFGLSASHAASVKAGPKIALSAVIVQKWSGACRDVETMMKQIEEMDSSPAEKVMMQQAAYKAALHYMETKGWQDILQHYGRNGGR
jgi:hypothetical protein